MKDQKEVLDFIIGLMKKNGKMRTMDVFKTIYAIHKDVSYTNIEQTIRVNSIGERSSLSKVKKGVYSLNHKVIRRSIKSRFKLSNHKVSDNHDNKIAVVEKVISFDPCDHLGYIKIISDKMAKDYKYYNVEPYDIYMEAISLAYEHRGKFDPSKGNPTTFIHCQIANRLRNKINRELIPNYFKTEYVENNDGVMVKEQSRVFISAVSLNSTKGKDSDVEIADCLSDDNLHNDYKVTEYRPDKEAEENDKYSKIIDILNSLDEREAIIIKKTFGFIDDPQTLGEISKDLNITKERVRQIKINALNKLKHNGKLALLAV